jgi:hypothetical protein
LYIGRLVDERVRVGYDRLLLVGPRVLFGEKGLKTFLVEMRHRLARQIAHHQLGIRIAGAQRGDELIGEAAGLAVARIQAGVDLQDRLHGTLHQKVRWGH